MFLLSISCAKSQDNYSICPLIGIQGIGIKTMVRINNSFSISASFNKMPQRMSKFFTDNLCNLYNKSIDLIIKYEFKDAVYYMKKTKNIFKQMGAKFVSEIKDFILMKNKRENKKLSKKIPCFVVVNFTRLQIVK